MRVLAVMNQKGGSGKTTSAVNLASALGEMGLRVLVIDLDPQASASVWFGVREEGRELLEVFIGERSLEEIIQETEVAGVELVAASPWLVGLERALSGEVGIEGLLREAIKALPDGRWDYLLMDCPPSLGLLSVSALVAADEVLVPVEASTMALQGLAALMRTIEGVKARLHPELKILGLLLCRVDRTRIAKAVEGSLRGKFEELVFSACIPENVKVREAWGHSKPITIYAPNSKAALAYRAVARELEER